MLGGKKYLQSANCNIASLTLTSPFDPNFSFLLGCFIDDAQLGVKVVQVQSIKINAKTSLCIAHSLT